MEFASYLAGERWSDHPACTQGTLALLARLVNDRTSDAGRAQLTPLIPRVIGLTSDDPLLDVLLAVRAAHDALPVAAEERQRSQAVALHVAIVFLAEHRDVLAAEAIESARSALRAAPGADAWAARFIDQIGPMHRAGMSVRQSREVVTGAVHGISQACVGDADDRLVALLTAAVSIAERFVSAERAAADAAAPAAARADTRVAG
ncbi:hypothetical protein LQ757_15270 [Agromyces sp. SYSU K20354]|uniref:hypothetical protein n=1 Tax=Agromyces cavernae TaxID=2898659 RepID=UPI001E4EA984|nr:hypothetical protein [Agromyces cavernae]MCD2443639.1 hypothetical protein [Agromyces cavernae]